MIFENTRLQGTCPRICCPASHICIPTRRFSETKSLWLTAAIASDLTSEVIHRDLKPENVLIVRSFLGPEPLCAEMSGSPEVSSYLSVVPNSLELGNQQLPWPLGCWFKERQKIAAKAKPIAMAWKEVTGVALLLYGCFNTNPGREICVNGNSRTDSMLVSKIILIHFAQMFSSCKNIITKHPLININRHIFFHD